jgi:hypothetical protein
MPEKRSKGCNGVFEGDAPAKVLAKAKERPDAAGGKSGDPTEGKTSEGGPSKSFEKRSFL